MIKLFGFSVILFLGSPIRAAGTVADCPPTESVYVRGQSMEPLLKPEQKIQIQKKYQDCGLKIDRGSLVIVKNSRFPIGAVKKVYAVPGDNVSLEKDQILVNGAPCKSSDGIPLRNEFKMLSIYIKKNPTTVMPPKTYLVLGDNNSAPYDSRRFGLVDESDLIALVKQDP